MNGKEALGLILLFGCLVCLVILAANVIRLDQFIGNLP